MPESKTTYGVWYYADLEKDTPRTKEVIAERADAEMRAAVLGRTLWWVDVYANLPHAGELRLMSFGQGTIHKATKTPESPDYLTVARCYCGYRTVNLEDMEPHFVLADREWLGFS